MNSKDNGTRRRDLVCRAGAGCTVAAIALLAVWVTPAAAEPVQPEREAAAAVTVDIAELVLERRLQIAADRAARPAAYGGTWRG